MSGTPTNVSDKGPGDDRRVRALLAELREEFPSFRILPKAGNRLSRCIDLALKLLTCGKQDRYMTEYRTVIGSTLYVPVDWDRTPPLEKLIVLRHERVHLRQRRRFGLVGMAIIYLVPILPLGLAYGRARLEWEAYEETLRATAELYGIARLRSASFRTSVVNRFTGPDYGWMWPFERHVQSWYDEALRKIETDIRPATREPLE